MWQILAVIAFYLQSLHARNGVTSSTGALLAFPFDNSLPNMTVTPAEFGIHVYGGHVRGLLVIAADPKYRTQCPQTFSRNSTQEPIGINPYLAAINNFSTTGNQERWIMMIDRGDCFFVDKVKHAEDLGADAVIVVDRQVEGLVIMWPPENFVQNTIQIPSVFVSEANGKLLYDLLGVTGFELNSNEPNLSYPDYHSYPRVTASIEWGLPHPDDHVEWEMWTSADDKLSKDFWSFGEISENLTLSNDAFFTPHYVILDGNHWGCVAPGLPCGGQCTNGGRYCSEDPEQDLQKGITGAHVVKENLRQMCVFQYANKTHDYLLWWKYVRQFHARCYDVPNYQASFGETCSFQVMDQLVPQNLRNFVDQCIKASGNYLANNGTNTMLQNEVVLREHSGVYISPTVSINGFHIYGRLSCPLPIKTDTCQAFQAICAGFLEGTEPAICLANEVSCQGVYDCKGNCDGGYSVDACNECLPPNSTQRDACLDCSNTPNGGKILDCNGVCGGSGRINKCGVCGNQQLPNWDKLGTDCSGMCGATNVNDRCGQCLAPLSEKFDNCVGCDNVPFSNKTWDCARVCGGPHVVLDCPNGAIVCVSPSNPNHAEACARGNQTASASDAASGGASSTSIILIVLSVLALCLVLVVLGIMYKNRQDTNERFNQLINQYQPLDNEPQHGTTTKAEIDDTRTLQEDEA